MKTFKEWYQSLGEKAQARLKIELPWLDTKTDDFFAKTELTKDNEDDIVMTCLNKIANSGSYYLDNDITTKLAFVAVQNYLAQNPKALDKEARDFVICKIGQETHETRDMLTKEYRRMLIRKNHPQEEKYSLRDLLYLTDDFDNIEWGKLKLSCKLDDAMCEMISKDVIIEKLKEQPELIRIEYGNYDNDIFDELFFGKDGWTEQQKHRVIKDIYDGSGKAIEDFVGRLVTVDKSCLKYIMDMIRYSSCDSNLTEAAKRKKPEDELEAKNIPSSSQMAYFYNKELRTAFQIAWCCRKERLAATRAKNVGELASIIKLYNYDYAQIMEALYPLIIDAIQCLNDRFR